MRLVLLLVLFCPLAGCMNSDRLRVVDGKEIEKWLDRDELAEKHGVLLPSPKVAMR